MDQIKIWDQYKGRIVGTLIGIICGFIYLIVGFWDTLCFVLFVYSGYRIGRWGDGDEDKLFWPLPLSQWWDRCCQKYRSMRYR